jgi:predicted GH43/DUF377 family glycosyl hydrolase
LTIQASQLFQRYNLNPILTTANWPYQVNSVFNPGATLLADGTTLLLCRVEDRRGHSHLCAARSTNGVDGWVIDSKSTFMADLEHYPDELWGIEDPRITYVPELGQYAIVYTAYASGGPGVALALTKDFHSFERLGVIMQPENKDAALLPHRIDGQWALIHRPVSATSAHMWIILLFGSAELGRSQEDTGSTPRRLVGCKQNWSLVAPIETLQGWLVIYHGVKQNAAGCIYRLGLALFDLHQPERCLKRGDEWVFGPEEPYEQHGDVDKVVSPAAILLRLTAILFASIMARQIQVLPWQQAV